MMKFKIYKIVSLALVFAAVSSCKNLTDGYSTDPVNITDPSVIGNSKYLSGIEMSLIAIYEGDMGIYTGIWSAYFRGEIQQFGGFTNHIITADDMDVTWQVIYNNVLKNHLILEEKALASRDYTLLAISQVNVALALGLAADLWGDVPYSEAGKYPAVLNPKFESQSSIYAAVQKLLDDALANFNKNLGSAGGDFFLAEKKNNWKDNWIKVIHSAKARYYLHTKDYQKAVEEGLLGISNAGENLNAPHKGSSLKDANWYYSFFVTNRSGYMSARDCYAPQLLDTGYAHSRGNKKTDEKARLWWYYAPGGLKKNFNYEPNYACPADKHSYTGFFGDNSSFPLITFEETTLTLAEAYMKLAVPDFTSALFRLNELRKYYNTGAPFLNRTVLKNTFKYEKYDEEDFSVGGMANTKGDPPNKALLREILEERFVSFIGQIEGWTDMRRTNNYLGLPLARGKTNFPRRMLYPQIEVNTNTNTPKGIGMYEDVPSFKTPY